MISFASAISNCGNGLPDEGEECDNGEANVDGMLPLWDFTQGTGDRAYCSTSCERYIVLGTWCGDQVVNGPEECDNTSLPNCVDCMLDDEGPDITNIYVDPAWPSCTQDSYIYATITDENGLPPVLPQIFLHWKYNGYAWAVKQFTLPPGGDVYRVRVPTDGPTNAESFKYFIEAADIFGNIAYSGDETNYLEFRYDCANPTASVSGMPSGWTSSATATAECTDDASNCNPGSYRLYVSPTYISTCPTDPGVYTLSSPSPITAHAWVCSYVEDNVGNWDISNPEEFLVDGVSPTADANGLYNCNEGTTIPLDGTGSSDDNWIASYAWDLDYDGQYDDSTSPTPDFVCIDGDASHTVSLRVTDPVGNIDYDDATVNVDNVAPWNLDAGEPYSGNEGTNVPFSGSASDVPDDTLSYSWDLNDDGVYETLGQNVEFTCVDDLVDYPISMRVTDEDGGESTASTTVTCYNVNPWDVNAGEPYSGNEGTNVPLSGGNAEDVPDDTLSYSWDLNDDGVYETLGQNVEFTCVDDLVNYPISMKVSDEDGGESSDDTTVTCFNVDPVVDAGEDQTVNEGDTVTITPTFTDVGVLDTHTATVDWGDGSTTEEVDPATSPMSLTHVYCVGGEHTVTVTVTDDDEGSDSDTLVVTVENVAPTIVSTGGPYFGIIGEHITFTAEAEDVCGNQELSYSWDFSPEGIQHALNVASWNSHFDGTVLLTVSDGVDSVSEEVPVTIYDYKIELDEGWNLISIPLVPENDNVDINFVLGQIVSNAERVWSYTYDPNLGKNVWKYNELVDEEWTDTTGRVLEVVPGYGYYVLMNEAATIYANGEKFYGVGNENELNIPMPPSVTLDTNSWNLIGAYGLEDVSPAYALETLETPFFGKYYDVIYDENGYSPFRFVQTEGYWLSVKLIPDAETIEYKANYKTNFN